MLRYVFVHAARACEIASITGAAARLVARMKSADYCGKTTILKLEQALSETQNIPNRRTAIIGASDTRVAAFQRQPRFDDVPGTVERLCEDLAWCDVQLAVFPECYLQAYASDRQTIARRALPPDGDAISGVLRKLGRFPPDIATRWRPKSLENIRRRAAETRCWVVASDVVGDHAGKTSYGCTCIVRPDGLIVSRATERTEEVVVFDLA